MNWCRKFLIKFYSCSYASSGVQKHTYETTYIYYERLTTNPCEWYRILLSRGSAAHTSLRVGTLPPRRVKSTTWDRKSPGTPEVTLQTYWASRNTALIRSRGEVAPIVGMFPLQYTTSVILFCLSSTLPSMLQLSRKSSPMMIISSFYISAIISCFQASETSCLTRYLRNGGSV